MFRQFEIILTILFLVLSAVFLTVIIFRIRNIYFKKNARLPIWKKEVGILNRVGKLTMAISLFLMAPSIIYFIFIVTIPSAVIRVYAKTLFCIIFITWAFLEIFLCLSISEKLLKGSKFRRITFFLRSFYASLLLHICFRLFPSHCLTRQNQIACYLSYLCEGCG